MPTVGLRFARDRRRVMSHSWARADGDLVESVRLVDRSTADSQGAGSGLDVCTVMPDVATWSFTRVCPFLLILTAPHYASPTAGGSRN